MPKMAEYTPNNVHWLDWRKKRKMPTGLEGNGIRISSEDLAKLKKAISDSGKEKNHDKR